MNVFDLMAKLGLDTSEYEEGLDKAKKGSSTFGQVLKANLVTKGIELVSKGLVTAGKEMVAFAKAAVQTGASFDTAMSQVAATMGVTTDEIGELRDFAQEMGAKTAFSATQAAEALNYMALAGYDAQTSMSMLPTVLNLAAAGSMDLARASDMVTDAQSALGLSLEQTSTMVDQMAAASSKSNTSVEQLGDAFLTIGATARNLKGGTQELATVLGVLADNGIKGAEGGTHLRNMILSLQNPTSDAAKALDSMNISLYDDNGQMRSMIDVIGDLREGVSTLKDQAEIDEKVGSIFNKTDLAAVNALLGTSQERFEELGAAIKDSAGAAEQMANTQLDNMNGDITLMQSALEGVRIQFSDGITPAIRNVVQTITKALSKRSTMKYLNELGKKLGEVTKTLTGKVMNALPKVMSLFEDGSKKIKVAAGALTAFAIAIEATVNPAAALTHGLTLVAGVFGTVALTADSTRKKFGKLTEAQQENIDTAKDAVDAYKELKDSRDDTVYAIQQETDKTRDLWTELQSLADSEGNVSEENQEHAQTLINKLNEALGTELELVNGQITGYDTLAGSIENVLQKKQAESMYAAVAEQAEQARKNLDDYSAAIYDQGVEVDNLKAQLALYDAQLAEVSESDKLDAVSKESQIALIQKQRDALSKQVDAAEADLERLKNAEREARADMALADEAYMLLQQGMYAEAAELIANDTTNRLQHKVELGTISEQEIQELERNADLAKAALERYQQDLQAGAAGYTEEELQQMQQHVDELEALLAEANEKMAEKGSEGSTNYVENVEEGTTDAAAAGDALAGSVTESLWAKVSEFGAAARASLAEYLGNLGPARGAIGRSHAIGNDYVPYNNYPALLHRGEAVLTAREADEWRRGGSGGRANSRPIELTVETPVEMDGAVVARKIYKYIINEGDIHGDSLIMA